MNALSVQAPANGGIEDTDLAFPALSEGEAAEWAAKGETPPEVVAPPSPDDEMVKRDPGRGPSRWYVDSPAYKLNQIFKKSGYNRLTRGQRAWLNNRGPAINYLVDRGDMTVEDIENAVYNGDIKAIRTIADVMDAAIDPQGDSRYAGSSQYYGYGENGLTRREIEELRKRARDESGAFDLDAVKERVLRDEANAITFESPYLRDQATTWNLHWQEAGTGRFLPSNLPLVVGGGPRPALVSESQLLGLVPYKPRESRTLLDAQDRARMVHAAADFTPLEMYTALGGLPSTHPLSAVSNLLDERRQQVLADLRNKPRLLLELRDMAVDTLVANGIPWERAAKYVADGYNKAAARGYRGEEIFDRIIEMANARKLGAGEGGKVVYDPNGYRAPRKEKGPSKDKTTRGELDEDVRDAMEDVRRTRDQLDRSYDEWKQLRQQQERDYRSYKKAQERKQQEREQVGERLAEEDAAMAKYEARIKEIDGESGSENDEWVSNYLDLAKSGNGMHSDKYASRRAWITSDPIARHELRVNLRKNQARLNTLAERLGTIPLDPVDEKNPNGDRMASRVAGMIKLLRGGDGEIDARRMQAAVPRLQTAVQMIKELEAAPKGSLSKREQAVLGVLKQAVNKLFTEARQRNVRRMAAYALIDHTEGRQTRLRKKQEQLGPSRPVDSTQEPAQTDTQGGAGVRAAVGGGSVSPTVGKSDDFQIPDVVGDYEFQGYLNKPQSGAWTFTKRFLKGFAEEAPVVDVFAAPDVSDSPSEGVLKRVDEMVSQVKRHRSYDDTAGSYLDTFGAGLNAIEAVKDVKSLPALIPQLYLLDEGMKTKDALRFGQWARQMKAPAIGIRNAMKTAKGVKSLLNAANAVSKNAVKYAPILEAAAAHTKTAMDYANATAAARILFGVDSDGNLNRVQGTSEEVAARYLDEVAGGHAQGVRVRNYLNNQLYTGSKEQRAEAKRRLKDLYESIAAAVQARYNIEVEAYQRPWGGRMTAAEAQAREGIGAAAASYFGPYGTTAWYMLHDSVKGGVKNVAIEREANTFENYMHAKKWYRAMEAAALTGDYTKVNELNAMVGLSPVEFTPPDTKQAKKKADGSTQPAAPTSKPKQLGARKVNVPGFDTPRKRKPKTPGKAQ